jgi:hypothetical protein
MKHTHTMVWLPLALLSALGLGWVYHTAAREKGSKQPVSTEGSGAVPVILELFTSEGCSSCPPADALLAKLEAQQPIADVQVIAMEEHVDYWNELGWVDPFSSKEWTDRQEDYANSLGNGNPYTPQLVVNGDSEFVGSYEDKARHAIETAARSPRTTVSIAPASEGSDKNGSAHFDVSVGPIMGGAPDDEPEVWLAITEAGLHSAVGSGENAGRELRHASVLRSLHDLGKASEKKDPSFSRNVAISVDRGWKRENLRAVVFVQERKSRQIIGAATLRLDK